jgi:hypothetical protein
VQCVLLRRQEAAQKSIAHLVNVSIDTQIRPYASSLLPPLVSMSVLVLV